MTDDMEERVALALFNLPDSRDDKARAAIAATRERVNLQLNNYLRVTKSGHAGSAGGFNESWDIICKTMEEAAAVWYQEHCRKLASAAIAAMREPTIEMVEAGYNVSTAGYEEEAKIVWQAMVDAALKGSSR